MTNGYWFDIALYVPGDRTLKELHAILDKLDDMDVEVDYGSFEFEDNGLFFEARYSEKDGYGVNDFEAIDGLEIDWGTMAEWDDYYGGGEEE